MKTQILILGLCLLIQIQATSFAGDIECISVKNDGIITVITEDPNENAEPSLVSIPKGTSADWLQYTKDMYDAARVGIDRARDESEKIGKETGLSIIRDKTSKIDTANYVIGDKDFVRLNHKIEKDKELAGEIHAHVCDKVKNSLAFSSEDIYTTTCKKGFVSFLVSCKDIYVLVVENEKKAKAFFKKKTEFDIQKLWNGGYKGISYEERVVNATLTVLGSKSGIGFYKLNDRKENFIKIKP